jgi:hypothetical protein
MSTTTLPIMLTGQSLVDFVDDKMTLVNRQELTRTDMIKDAGYVNSDGKALYTEFYTELLRAKGVVPVTDSDVEDDSYDNLSDDDKGLYDVVDDRFGRTWDHETVLEFIDILKENGIEDKRSFDDNFYGRFDSEKDFAQEYYEGMGAINDDNPLYHHIDWDSVARELSYDYDYVSYDYELFVFRK